MASVAPRPSARRPALASARGSVRAVARILGVGGVLLVLTTGAVGCAREDDGPERGYDASSATATSGPTGSPDASTPNGSAGYPPFNKRDYTYVLEVLCYCPRVGPVRVTVADGRVTDAVLAQAGDPAPEYARLGIADILARAGEPDAADVQVEWPKDSDHPTSVTIDRLAAVSDDEVTYLVSDVRVSAG